MEKILPTPMSQTPVNRRTLAENCICREFPRLFQISIQYYICFVTERKVNLKQVAPLS